MTSDNRNPISNFYGALGDYEKSVRERKFLIAESEDKISNLKATLQETRLQNEKLKSKCETLKFEADMENARFESETHKKSNLEAQDALSGLENEEVSGAVEDKKAFIEKIEYYKESRISDLKKQEQDFMERYKKIPSIGTYLDLSSKLKNYETFLQEKRLIIQEKHSVAENRTLKSQIDWKNFKDICIRIAVTRDALQMKTKDYEDIVRRHELRKTLASNSTAISKENVIEDLDKSVGIIRGPTGPRNIQIMDTPALIEINPIKSHPNTEKCDGFRSISLDERLQRIRNRSFTFNNDFKPSAPPSGTVGLGIKRYYNAVEELKSKGTSSGYQEILSPENNLQKSITDIQKRFSRQSLPISSKSESGLKQQLQGYKTTYSSWLTEMVNTENLQDQQSKAKKAKSDDVSQDQENCESIMNPSKVSNEPSQSQVTVENSSAYFDNVMRNKSPTKFQPDLDEPIITNVEKPKHLSLTNQSSSDIGIPPNAAGDGDTSTSNCSKFKITTVSTPALLKPSNVIQEKNDTSGLFKVPPLPLPRSSLNSKSSPFGNVSDLFIGDGLENRFSMNSNSSTLDIFGNTSTSLEDSGIVSDEDSSTSCSSHALFDFENFFGPVSGEKNSALF